MAARGRPHSDAQPDLKAASAQSLLQPSGAKLGKPRNEQACCTFFDRAAMALLALMGWQPAHCACSNLPAASTFASN